MLLVYLWFLHSREKFKQFAFSKWPQSQQSTFKQIEIKQLNKRKQNGDFYTRHTFAGATATPSRSRSLSADVSVYVHWPGICFPFCTFLVVRG